MLLSNYRQAADRFIKGDIVIALNLLEHLAKVSTDSGSINPIFITISFSSIFYFLLSLDSCTELIVRYNVACVHFFVTHSTVQYCY